MSWWDRIVDFWRKYFSGGPEPTPKPPVEPIPEPKPEPEPEPEPSPEPEPEPEPSPEPGGENVFKSFWIHWNSVLKNDAAGREIIIREAKRRAYILLNTWDHWMIPIAKGANPDVKCFVYKDASSTRSYDSNPVELQPCGVNWASAPEDWFTHNPGGGRIEYSGYSGHWLMNVGHQGYQTAWANNVLYSVRKYGFDGVFIDNLLWTQNAYGGDPVEYSTDADMQSKYAELLVEVRETFRDTGKLMLGNLSNARLVHGRWGKYMTYLDGGWDEWWLVISDVDLLSEYAAGWTRVVSEVKINEIDGKITLVQPHFSKGAQQPFLYAYASYLMVAHGRAAIAEIQERDGYGQPSPWHQEYDWDLGQPLGAYTTQSTNVHVRYFERGAAAVNANRTGTAEITVDLGEYGTVRLGGTQGIVLRKESPS